LDLGLPAVELLHARALADQQHLLFAMRIARRRGRRRGCWRSSTAITFALLEAAAFRRALVMARVLAFVELGREARAQHAGDVVRGRLVDDDADVFQRRLHLGAVYLPAATTTTATTRTSTRAAGSSSTGGSLGRREIEPQQ